MIKKKYVKKYTEVKGEFRMSEFIKTNKISLYQHVKLMSYS